MRHFMTVLALVSSVGFLSCALALAFGWITIDSPALFALNAGLAWLIVLIQHKTIGTQQQMLRIMRTRLAQLGAIAIITATLVACGDPPSHTRVYRDFICRDTYGRTTLFVSASSANMHMTATEQQQWSISTKGGAIDYATKVGERCGFGSR